MWYNEIKSYRGMYHVRRKVAYFSLPTRWDGFYYLALASTHIYHIKQLRTIHFYHQRRDAEERHFRHFLSDGFSSRGGNKCSKNKETSSIIRETYDTSV